MVNCDYDIEDEFNESLVDNVRNLNYYYFFLHLNICSLAGDFGRLLIFVTHFWQMFI